MWIIFEIEQNLTFNQNADMLESETVIQLLIIVR